MKNIIINESILNKKEDILLIHLKGETADQNNNIQLVTKNKELYLKAKKAFFTLLKEKYPSLIYFLQGDYFSQSEYWLMFETWSDDDDLFFKSVTDLADYLELPYDFAS